VVGRSDRLAVLVGAQEARIERVAGEVEVVGIAAERCRAILRRPRQADVRVFVVGVELVLTAAEQGHDLAAGGCGVGAAGLFQLGDLGIARLGQRLTGQVTEHALHLRRHVGDPGHDLGLLAGALEFKIAAVGDVTVVEIVLRAVRIVEQAARHAVVVGEDQALAGDEARRASAGQAHRGVLHAVQPGLVGRPAIVSAHLGGREVVEGPHAFVGTGGRGGEGQRGGGQEQAGTDHQLRLPKGLVAFALSPSPLPRKRKIVPGGL
jgi:hypothetical protein